jgi:hypothetical protein
MNATDNYNDPFEDIFRDRFADFESEPSEILWNKIEPQLPVKTTRRFPYWQVSALILGLFLGGIYLNDARLPTLSDSSDIKLPNAVVSVSTDDSKRSSVETLTTAETTAREKRSSVETQTTAENNIIEKSSLFSKPNTTIELLNTSLGSESSLQTHTRTTNNISENSLNHSNFEPSNSKITINSTIEPNNKNLGELSNSSNIFEKKNVSINSNQNVIERKFNYSILDNKSYGLLINHFKSPKIKFVPVPKEEPYFKERKPLELYVSAMPLLNYYTITPNGNEANLVHTIAVNDDADRVGFHTQAGLIFTLSDRLKLRTGLTFTRTNHSISYQVRTDSLVVQPADNKGVDISFAELNKTYSQAANYLGTKFDVQYTFLQGEALTHYVSVGGEASYRLNGNKALNGFANFAYGITRQIGDNAYLFVEPTFSYSLNQQSDNSSLLLVKPNKIGFNIGVNFKLK